MQFRWSRQGKQPRSKRFIRHETKSPRSLTCKPMVNCRDFFVRSDSIAPTTKRLLIVCDLRISDTG